MSIASFAPLPLAVAATSAVLVGLRLVDVLALVRVGARAREARRLRVDYPPPRLDELAERAERRVALVLAVVEPEPDLARFIAHTRAHVRYANVTFVIAVPFERRLTITALTRATAAVADVFVVGFVANASDRRLAIERAVASLPVEPFALIIEHDPRLLLHPHFPALASALVAFHPGMTVGPAPLGFRRRLAAALLADRFAVDRIGAAALDGTLTNGFPRLATIAYEPGYSRDARGDARDRAVELRLADLDAALDLGGARREAFPGPRFASPLSFAELIAMRAGQFATFRGRTRRATSRQTSRRARAFALGVLVALTAASLATAPPGAASITGPLGIAAATVGALALLALWETATLTATAYGRRYAVAATLRAPLALAVDWLAAIASIAPGRAGWRPRRAPDARALERFYRRMATFEPQAPAPADGDAIAALLARTFEADAPGDAAPDDAAPSDAAPASAILAPEAPVVEPAAEGDIDAGLELLAEFRVALARVDSRLTILTEEPPSDELLRRANETFGAELPTQVVSRERIRELRTCARAVRDGAATGRRTAT